ncbi:RES family NAD+ phosphorylase [Deinococcus soli (ex Cha et al. 2016)]|uniref:RES domain-containing protein n=2 Tax=Deinococcus soli (ex Cha et al. 2016) TaxID=1309411 RepID=A0AAE3XCM4_9DEIO|nr:RES family NAD+ phosphorylase [Deinococcus soli (ex Cha et al. 2016)]MDR6218861.1 hypothetical protein [Deinococcus soli (ex Cha et al. 2016)]MDR6328658.1 hypothetical protein [Deinococcus soli (ex Cha et al. 2016)]MDR6751855.1 hypothetical protein [Deinococcus soli (ex Cha et al. 2016)]
MCNHLYPFLWNAPAQPAARWHALGDGPVQYLADSPEGAWAEVLRHAEAVTADEVLEQQRSVWAITMPSDLDLGVPDLALDVLIGGEDTYPACQAEARRLRDAGHDGLIAPSAALLPGGCHPYLSGDTITPDEARRSDGQVIVLFGNHLELPGWRCAQLGSAHPDLLGRIRWLPGTPLN